MRKAATAPKTDPASQTKAVESLMKRLLQGPLSQYADKVFAVGGSVRDEQLGRSPKDLDLVVVNDQKGMDSAKDFTEDLVDVLGIRSERQPQALNEEYGIYGVTLFRRASDGSRVPFLVGEDGSLVNEGGTDISGYVIEVTPPRKEGPYSEGERRPDYVEYASIKEDQERRDLTINSIYKNLVTGELIDNVGGLNDIKGQVLRPPAQSEEGRSIEDIYREDPLRILRLIRFQDKTGGWGIPEDVQDIVKNFVKNNRDLVEEKLSKERIAEEFKKIITGTDPVRGMEMMKDMGVLWMLSPDLEKMLDMYHDTVFHKGESVWEHTMDVLSRTPPTEKARIAALFHDIGKVGTKQDKNDPTKTVPVMTTKVDSEGRDRVQFIGHEKASAGMIRKILKDLKLDYLIKDVAEIAESHMKFKDYKSISEKKLLKPMRLVIERLYNSLDDAISILKADSSDPSYIDDLEERFNRLKEEDVRNGILQDKGGKIQYVVPLDYAAILEEYSDLKGEIMGMVTHRLKDALLKGKITDQVSAKRELDNIMRQRNQFDNFIKKYRREKRVKPGKTRAV